MQKSIQMQKRQPTKRALDAGDSARFSSIFLASSLYCSQALSTPAPAQLTQVRWVTFRPHNEEEVCLIHREIYGQSGY